MLCCPKRRTWAPALAGAALFLGMHLGCLVIPATTLVLGVPTLKWICGRAPDSPPEAAARPEVQKIP